MVPLPNKYSFCHAHKLTPFYIKTNCRENRFFGQVGEVMDKKGSHCVKNYTEKRTKDEAVAGGLMSFRHWVN